MSKLKCREKECRHNHEAMCSKECIVLDSDAVCVSFQKKMFNEKVFHNEFAKEMTSNYRDTETAINCNDESCYHNHDCFCKASAIEVDNDAWCNTYRHK